MRGATIRFAQDGKWGAIHFRQEWIEEYLEQITVKPADAAPQQVRRAPRRKAYKEFSWDEI